MSISTYPHNSIFVSVPVNYLLLQPTPFISGTYILAVLRIHCVSTHNSCLFVGKKLLNCCLFLLLHALYVFYLKVPDFCLVFLFERLIFPHDAVHVAIINIYDHYLLALFQSLIFVFKTQFLTKFLLKLAPLVLLVDFGSFTVIDGCLMGLVMFRLISADVRVHVECFLVITVNDAPSDVFDIGPSIRFEGSLIKVVLVFGICERTSKGPKFFNIFLHLLAPLLLSGSLFLKLLLTNASP